MNSKVICGNNIDVLKGFPDDHFDSIVTDPTKCQCGKDKARGAQNKLLKTCGDVACEYASRTGVIRKPERFHKCAVCDNTTERQYCSIACANVGQTKYATTNTCSGCGVSYTPTNTKRKTSKFCSEQCCIDSGHRRQSAHAANLALQHNKQPTKPERKVYELLDASGIEYHKQYSIGHWVVDAYVPSLNLIIQVDGDYWHGNPQFYKTETLEPRIRRRIATDRSQEAWFKKAGYNIVRIWASDIETHRFDLGNILDNQLFKEDK